MADSYKIGDDEFRDIACFSYLNNTIISNREKGIVKDYYIILEKHKYEEYSKEDLDVFFSSIKEIGIIDFTEEYLGDDLYLKLNYKGQDKSYLQYTGMVIRCLYEKIDSKDFFHIIGKNFINLCKLFENIDKGLLFTLSCNIYINEYHKEHSENVYGFNSNHILMTKSGCLLLNTEQIIKKLNKNNGINNNFNDYVDLSKYELKDVSKESYLKLIKQNGIE